MPSERIRILDSFFMKKIADRPIHGQMATITKRLPSGVVLARVDGLEPYGHHGGQLAFAPNNFEFIDV